MKRDPFVEAQVAPYYEAMKLILRRLSGRRDLEASVEDLYHLYLGALVSAVVLLETHKKFGQAIAQLEVGLEAIGRSPKAHEPEEGKTSYLAVLRRSLQNLGNILADDVDAPMHDVKAEWLALVEAAREEPPVGE